MGKANRSASGLRDLAISSMYARPRNLFTTETRTMLFVFGVPSLGTCKIHVKTLSTGGVRDRFARALRAAKSFR